MFYKFRNFTINEKGNVQYLQLPITGVDVSINYNENETIESFDIDDKMVTVEEYNKQLEEIETKSNSNSSKVTTYESKSSSKAFANPNTIEGPGMVDEYVATNTEEDNTKSALSIIEISILDKKGREFLLSFDKDRLKRLETSDIDTTFLYKKQEYYQPLIENTIEISLENAIATIITYEDNNGERYTEEVLNG